MAETGMAVVNYLDLLETRAGQLLAQGPPGPSYARSVAAATEMIADRLAGEDPAAAELASIGAFFAPEPIPPELFTGAASVLPGELAAALPTRWPGTRPWPTWPTSRWPGSIIVGYNCTSSLRLSSATGSPPPKPPLPASAPRRSWLPATLATRLILLPGPVGHG